MRPFPVAPLLLLSGMCGCLVILDTEPLENGCASDEKVCNNRCVSRSDPNFGCARMACAPCVLSHVASASCGGDGECAVGSCAGTFADCDGNPLNGCEEDLDSSKDNCRRCGDKCDEQYPSEPHVLTTACSLRRCIVGKCEEGFLDCDGEIANGCEVDRLTDPDHCGACTIACQSPQACVGGTCQ